MPESLRSIVGLGGLVCVVAAFVSGGLEAPGWQLPVIESARVRLAIGAFGALLLVVAVAGPVALARLTRPKTATYVVETVFYDGDAKIEVRAAGYTWTDDGKMCTFIDRDSQPVRTLQRATIVNIERRDEDGKR